MLSEEHGKGAIASIECKLCTMKSTVEFPIATDDDIY